MLNVEDFIRLANGATEAEPEPELEPVEDTGMVGMHGLVDIAERMANNTIRDIDWNQFKQVLEIMLPVEDANTILAILNSGAVRVVISTDG